MILIISQDRFEESTNDLIDWLDHRCIPFIRINGIDIFRSIKISIKNDDYEMKIKDQVIDLSKITAIWIRRWFCHDNIKEMAFNVKGTDNHELKRDLNAFLKNELHYLNDFINRFFGSHKRLINANGIMLVNKLDMLKKASELGIKIPNTHVVTSQKDISEIIGDGSRHDYIVKAICNAPDIVMDEKLYMGYTSHLDTCEIADAETMAPSLIQKKINKSYEIRSFFIGQKFYSMAIFSQSNQKTSLDFRMYDKVFPNRYCPFKLPSSLEKKLFKLASQFNLSTGSIDLIKDKNGDIVFLEINPEGQYGMTSLPCNYNLDSIIAKHLVA